MPNLCYSKVTAGSFGINIPTDEITPTSVVWKSFSEMAKHVFESLNPEFSQKVQKGDIIVAGRTSDVRREERLPRRPSKRRVSALWSRIRSRERFTAMGMKSACLSRSSRNSRDRGGPATVYELTSSVAR